MKNKLALFNNRGGYILAFTLVFAVIVLINAWNCDDAYHGFVTVRNLLNGNGFVYNVGERVNICTCPLFVLILTAVTFIIREPSIAAFILCTIFSTATFYIIASRVCKNVWQAVFTFFVMITSYCFMSFTTSGLENSLLFLELACFVIVYSKNDKYDFKKLMLVAFIDALVLFTRTDVGFMLFVPTAYVFLFKRECSVAKMFGAGIIGLIPYIVWELFSAFYFGSWFPNPFYVKVGTSIPISEYIIHGLQYLLTSFIYDVVLMLPIFIAIIALLSNKKVNYKIFGIGMIMKILWVIYMGGDFMIGRHFTDSFLVSITWISVLVNESVESAVEKAVREKQLKMISFIALTICVFTSMDNRTNITKPIVFPERGVQCADEKAGYYPTLGLLPRLIAYVSEGIDTTDRTWVGEMVDQVQEAIDRGDKGIVDSVAAPGVVAYKYINKIYFIDNMALGDAFLSKFPSIYTYPWRVGHTARKVPTGYADSIKYGDNRLEDPDLREYYDMYLEVTRGKLFSGKRAKLAFEFAMGKYDYLIDRYVEKSK